MIRTIANGLDPELVNAIQKFLTGQMTSSKKPAVVNEDGITEVPEAQSGGMDINNLLANFGSMAMNGGVGNMMQMFMQGMQGNGQQNAQQQQNGGNTQKRGPMYDE